MVVVSVTVKGQGSHEVESDKLGESGMMYGDESNG